MYFHVQTYSVSTGEGESIRGSPPQMIDSRGEALGPETSLPSEHHKHGITKTKTKTKLNLQTPLKDPQ